MTKEEARLILLEHAVEQSQNTIDFMHQCLMDIGSTRNGKHVYTYPGHTTEFLKELCELVPPKKEICFHSMTVPGCKSCEHGSKWRKDRYEARKTLGIEDEKEINQS